MSSVSTRWKQASARLRIRHSARPPVNRVGRGIPEGAEGPTAATAGHREGGVRGTLSREIHLYVVLDSVLDAHVHPPPPPKRDGPYAHGMIPKRDLHQRGRHPPKSPIHIHFRLPRPRRNPDRPVRRPRRPGDRGLQELLRAMRCSEEQRHGQRQKEQRCAGRHRLEDASPWRRHRREEGYAYSAEPEPPLEDIPAADAFAWLQHDRCSALRASREGRGLQALWRSLTGPYGYLL